MNSLKVKNRKKKTRCLLDEKITIAENLNVASGYRLMIGYFGIFTMMIGGICLLPLLVLIFYPSEWREGINFLVPGLISIIVGFGLSKTIKEKGQLKKYQDAILVVGIWIIAIVICSFPLFMSGKYTYTQSLFEAVSGFSTTGLSIVDVDNEYHIYLMFRSIMLFFGGVGLVLILMSAISDRLGMKLYTAEGHCDKLMPNLARSARLILSIYFGYIVIGALAFRICGMNTFDAINHAIAAISTGGFSTHSESIAYYDNVAVEIVAMVLMLLGATNFVLHVFLFKRRFKDFIKHCETKMFLVFTAIGVPLLTYFFYKNSNIYSIGESFRISIFQFISAITTTGFQSIGDFHIFPPIGILILIILMLMGLDMGSTSGGMKQYRVVVFLKGLYYQLKDKMSSSRVVKTHYVDRLGERTKITDAEYKDCSTFILLYLIVFIFGSILFCITGMSLSDAMFNFSSSLSGVGIWAGKALTESTNGVLWISMFGMFVGRLEIIVVYTAFVKLFRDITRRETI